MSEPTNGGRQQPDPDPKKNRDKVQDEASDQTPEPVFSDPTAPVWADPTAPMPAPPTPPGAAGPQNDEPPAGPFAPQPPTPPVAPPLSNPYAQQPPVQPYGQPPAQPYGLPPYGQPPAQPYGQAQSAQQYPVYSQQPYAVAPHTEANGSAIVLTILSGVSLVFCNLLAIASLIFGILALTKNSTDHGGSRRYTKIGWIVFAVCWAIAVLGLIAYIIFIATSVSNGSISNDMFGN